MEAPAWQDYLHSLAAFGMRPGLSRVEALLQLLGEPQRRFRAIHIVGTNGKSSTTRYCEAILRTHGLRSGGYISPHITGWEERVIVDGHSVAAATLGDAVLRVRERAAMLPEALGPVTQFEVLTVAAFLVLAEAGVEAAAIEAGLGGRLDATNVLHAPVVVLTNIALEHTEVLGHTREAIFAEKAAVITTGAEAVFGALDGLTELAQQRCADIGATAHFFGSDIVATGSPESFSVATNEATYEHLSVASAARYQVVNAALAVAASELLLGKLGRRLEEAGLRTALTTTVAPGRLQVVAQAPLMLADGAHNPHGAAALVASLRTLPVSHPTVAVLAIMRDKDAAAMLTELLPVLDEVICTQASEPRSRTADDLAALVERAHRVRVVREPDAHRAVELARAHAGTRGTVLITGSLYLLEDLADVLAAAQLGTLSA